MNDAATCKHQQQYTDITPEGFHLRSCSCGIEAWAITPEDARRIFASKAEEAWVEGIKIKQERGERLTSSELTYLSYSPFGWASRCGY